MTAGIIGEFNREPGYETGWHTHDSVMILAPVHGGFIVADEADDIHRKVPPGILYWVDAHCGHSSRAENADQLHWVCYASREIARPNRQGKRSGIVALSSVAEQLILLLRLLTEDPDAATEGGLHAGVEELLWRACAAQVGRQNGQEIAQSRNAARLVQSVKTKLYSHLEAYPRLDEIAEACGVSRRHLTRLFRRETGMSIHEQLTTLRMQRAAVLLAKSELTILQIAGEVGLYNPSHFSRAFRSRYGVSPSAFRKRVH